jgi:hypothetical protein
MSLLRRLRGTSLLTRFGVLSLLLTVALGAVLSSVLTDAITERAREQAESTVTVTVRLGLQPQLTPRDLANGFDPRAVDRAAENMGGGESLDDLDPVELKVFNRDREIVYHSENRELIGETSTSDELGEALEGHVATPTASPATRSCSRCTCRCSTTAAPARTAPWSSTCPTGRWPPPSARTSAP